MVMIMLIPLLSLFWLRSLSPVEAANATTRENVGCSFHLSCSGGFNGSIGEKGSGQARAGGGGSPSLFTWFGDAFADQQGGGCWWTPPTFTLQCDRNQTPDHGFQIGCDGTLSFNNQTVFYECPTGQGDEANIYLHPNGGQCHTVTIKADGCAPSPCPGGGINPSPSPSSSPSSLPSPSQGGGGAGPLPGTTNSASSFVPATSSTLATSPILPISSPSTNSSPTSSSLPTFSTSSGPLTPSPFTTGPANDQTTTTSLTTTATITATQPPPTSSTCITVVPDQIILTDKGNPDIACGPNSGMNIQVSPNASSIFNFYFSDSDLGKSCELSFFLPTTSTNPNGTPYNLTGTGFVTFAALDGWANANTTYSNSPRVIGTISNALLYPGISQGFGRFECPGSTSRTSIVLTEAPMADTCLWCVQGAVGDGIGMYLQKC